MPLTRLASTPFQVQLPQFLSFFMPSDSPCIFISLSRFTCYSSHLERLSLSFVPSKACPCMDLSSAALALGAPPQGPAALASDHWRDSPHTPLLLQHSVWFSVCGPQHVPGSGGRVCASIQLPLPHVNWAPVTCARHWAGP